MKWSTDLHKGIMSEIFIFAHDLNSDGDKETS
jgi:hypothetical protein